MTIDPSRLKIRRAHPEDVDAIQDFIGATYGNTAPHKGLKRWGWQFLDTPFRPSGDVGPTVWIATEGDRIAGQIAVQDGRLWLEGAHIAAGWIVDVMIRPEWRGYGLGHRIHAAVMKERPVLVTLTMAPATRRIAERAGGLTLGKVRQFIRPHSLRAETVRRFLAAKAVGRPVRVRGIRLFNASGLGPVAVAFGARLAARPIRRMAMRDGRIEEVARFPESIDALWQESRMARGALFERSASFLNWRFAEAPGLVYRRFLLWEDNGVAGYVITRLPAPSELSSGVVADLYARPGDTTTLDALLAHTTEVLAPHTEYLEAGASSPDLVAALHRAGFIATRTHRPTVVVTDPELRARLSRYAGPWHFTKADHDWDQVHPAEP